MTLSIFYLSFALGPLFDGPLSEIYGRQWVNLFSDSLFHFTGADADFQVLHISNLVERWELYRKLLVLLYSMQGWMESDELLTGNDYENRINKPNKTKHEATASAPCNPLTQVPPPSVATPSSRSPGLKKRKEV
jgi:hypothetical protein